MANLSIRGLDAKALAELKTRAAREDASVNTLVLRLIEQGLGHRRAKPVLRRHDDLDALAGSWRKSEGVDFERATAPFGEVDPQLWKCANPEPMRWCWLAWPVSASSCAAVRSEGFAVGMRAALRGRSSRCDPDPMQS